MKYRTTSKAIRNGTPADKLVSVGYCDLQHLLRGHEPIAYTCGVYGWSFDVYTVDGLTICTGYRGMPGRTANNYREYETRARRIWEDYKRPYEDRRAEADALLAEFIAQA